MPLKIYNTLTRKKEIFQPITPNEVKIYVCGVTPYDDCHLGHARAAVVFDVVFRYLKLCGYHVTYIRNFTDVDDKIIKKSNESKKPWDEIANTYIQSYQEQMKKLGVDTPTQEPRATEHIQEMHHVIQKLIDKKLAYVSENDVFFEVRKFKNYGKLSHKKIDELEIGARIEINEKKKDPLDFALWKSAKPDEPSWDSPWGPGRPGWHIECSAMSMRYLGESFDIHGGGRDLSFPHHENEIAQSEGASGKEPFARFWMHNGFVNINSEKMSKSLGNFLTVKQILEEWDPEVVRYFLLSSHYASPIDFNDKALKNSQEALSRIYETLLRLHEAPAGKEIGSYDWSSLLHQGLEDDFNTTIILGEVFRHIRQINTQLDKGEGWNKENKKKILKELQESIGKVLGIFHSDPQDFLERQKQKGLKKSSISESEIQSLITERKQARLAKNWKRSDEIRDQLLGQGIVLKDSVDGSTTWEIRPQ